MTIASWPVASSWYLEGGADLRAGTGDLHAIGVRGPLRLNAGTGDVHVERDR